MLVVMDVVIALMGLRVSEAVLATVPAVTDDGQRRRRPPHSHPEEVGSWIDQPLRP